MDEGSPEKEKLAIKSGSPQSPRCLKPLDYTFMCLTSFSDCLEEEPRGSKPLKSKEPIIEDDGEQVRKRKTNALRLSNNVLTEWGGFLDTVEKIVENPADLEWIDVSFNDLTTIDSCLLSFPKLKVLYLHGNGIEKINEVDKLTGLEHLRTLTLHGNPVEDSRKGGYRQYVLSRLPLLKTFDFSGVTQSDRASAHTWSQMVKGKRKKKVEN
ncbi:leucine-rich repeat-containing protein 51-like [Clytia hemisphaerica]|uniref:Leucine-rich repeat-containing protein 51 n=1 Tax=Clytia hemisphaerica TaxID=252671 RepID=A0A7M5TQM2_9CNID|eukprot:TCONS_00046139-protein